MKKYLLISLLCSLLVSCSIPAQDASYEVIKVVDWDTIKIQYEGELKNVRLIWVDTPELSPVRFWHKECYWQESTDFLKNILEGQHITLELDDSQWLLDRYGRVLAYVHFKGENINRKLIRQGYWRKVHYNWQPAYKYIDSFTQAMQQARDENLGLWEACDWERKNDMLDKLYNTIDKSCTRKTCKEIKSCTEAKYKLEMCWHTSLDRNKDGVPCESLCK